MNSDQADECKELCNYDDFMGYALDCSNLKMEDYKEFMPKIFPVVIESKEKDPFLFYEFVIDRLRELWTASDTLPFHGPWHHGLIAGIIIASLRNNGYEFNDNDVAEALKRGLMIPSGGCGFLGVCGAGIGIGIAFSIIEKATPLHEKERSNAMELSSRAIHRIARLGGPRCCTMSTYNTLDFAVRELKALGYDLPAEKSVGRCRDPKLNDQCHLERCPYYPRKK